MKWLPWDNQSNISSNNKDIANVRRLQDSQQETNPNIAVPIQKLSFTGIIYQ
jgi:hypothetical protein